MHDTAQSHHAQRAGINEHSCHGPMGFQVLSCRVQLSLRASHMLMCDAGAVPAVQDYPWGRFRRVLDIGGANG